MFDSSTLRRLICLSVLRPSFSESARKNQLHAVTALAHKSNRSFALLLSALLLASGSHFSKASLGLSRCKFQASRIWPHKYCWDLCLAQFSWRSRYRPWALFPSSCRIQPSSRIYHYQSIHRRRGSNDILPRHCQGLTYPALRTHGSNRRIWSQALMELTIHPLRRISHDSKSCSQTRTSFRPPRRL